MRDTIIMIAAIASVMGMIAYLNRVDIEACINKGNSEEVCERSFNR